jgi:hypothetical protein
LSQTAVSHGPIEVSNGEVISDRYSCILKGVGHRALFGVAVEHTAREFGVATALSGPDFKAVNPLKTVHDSSLHVRTQRHVFKDKTSRRAIAISPVASVRARFQR